MEYYQNNSPLIQEIFLQNNKMPIEYFEVFLQDRVDSLWKQIIVKFVHNWQNYSISEMINIQEYIWYYQTSTEYEILMQIMNHKIDLIAENICKKNNLNPIFKVSIRREIWNLLSPKIQYKYESGLKPILIPKASFIKKKPEIKIDPQIKEAAEIAEKAQNLQKYIMKETKEIVKEKVQYTKKYWTFTDKIKAYILNR